jgi:RNA polymerase sigma factor (sigma-70 family)
MAGGPSVALMRDIQTLFDAGTASGLSDRQLLQRFADRRDASAEAAFEVLVLRHGPMVLRVCRTVLTDPNDAQDAFQATFLVLVRRCGSIRRLESVGSWLFGVASRVAARARVEAARRRAVERRGGLRIVDAVDSQESGESPETDLSPVVQEEVRRLPEKYRAVVVLCYWQGLTQEQAATQLGCPLGTVRSRLARARDLLRRRLARRGLAPLAVAGAMGAETASATAPIPPTVPDAMVVSTVKAGAQVGTGRLVAQVTSASIAVLVQQVLRSMVMTKLKTMSLCLMLISLGAFGAILAAPQAGPERAATTRGEASPREKRKVQPPLHPLGDYVVEPPDMLLVEVLEALPGRPISGERLVRPDGKISLGFYGEIDVAGLTPAEVKEKVVLHLRKYLSDEKLGLVTHRTPMDKLDKNGDLIGPVANARETDRVFVEVTASNSKSYYVQGMVASPGRFPITGSETVLDAINLAGGLTPQADHANVVLYRGRREGTLEDLAIDIDQITMGGDPTTNYQLVPGDRLVVPRLRRLQPEPENPEADQSRETPRRAANPLYFDRRPDKQPDPLRDRLARPADAVVERASLLRVERRLDEVERKLDMILEALKPRTP